MQCDNLSSSAQYLANMARQYPRTTLMDFSHTKSPARKGRKGKREDKSTPACEAGRQREESTLLYSDGPWNCTSQHF